MAREKPKADNLVSAYFCDMNTQTREKEHVSYNWWTVAYRSRTTLYLMQKREYWTEEERGRGRAYGKTTQAEDLGRSRNSGKSI